MISIVEHIRYIKPDMEIGVDTGILSADIFENCGNFWILEDYLLSFSLINFQDTFMSCEKYVPSPEILAKM